MFNDTNLQRVQKRHQPPRCTMQHPQNIQENVLLYQQKHYLQILKNVSSVRIKHPVLNFMQLINAQSVYIELARSENFGKIKRRGCKAQELKYRIIVQQGKIPVKDEKTQTPMVKSTRLFFFRS